MPQVINCIESGMVPSKGRWKSWISKVINDYNHNMWRFEVHLYRKLDLFRTIVIKLEPSVWWAIVKVQPNLKKPCNTVVKLLTGVSVLNVHKNVDVPHHERICTHCNAQEIEDTYHLLMKCSLVDDIRR
jgi:hypothetical protein